MTGLMNFKYFFFFFIVIAVFIPPAAAAQPESDAIRASNLSIALTPDEEQWLAAHNTLRIAGPKAFPPFHYYDEKGRLQGLASDYLSVFLNVLDVDPVILSGLPWPQVLQKAKKKQVDLILLCAKSEKREAYLSFTRPYLSFPLVIVTRNDSPFVGGLDDLYGRKTAIIKGNVIYDWLKRDEINIEPYFTDTPFDALKAVSLGNADALIENLAAATYIIQARGLINLKIAAPTPYDDYELYAAVRKDWPHLTSIINKILVGMTPGQQAGIKSKWLSVKYERDIGRSLAVKWIVGTIMALGLVLLLIFLWNRKLADEIKDRKKIEKKLKESETQYRELFDTMPNGYYRSTPGGYYVEANPAFIEMMGYESLDDLKSAFIPKDIYVHESERQAVCQNFGFTDQVEIYRLKKKDGRIIWVEDNARYIKDKDGSVLYHQGICKDITDRKHAEEINSVLVEISNAVSTTRDLDELYASIHQSLARIIDVTNFHISLYDREQDSLTFVYWVDMKDQPPKNFQVYNISDPKTQYHTAEVIVSGKPVLHSKAQFEAILRQRGVAPCFKLSEIWLGVPLKIKDEIVGAMVAHSYINPNLYTLKDAEILLSVSNQVATAIERKKSENALRESEQKFRQIYTHILDVYYEASPDGIITEISPSIEKYSQYRREELIGRSIGEIFPGPEGQNAFWELLAYRGILQDYEALFRDKDDSGFICSLHMELIKDANGNPEKIVSIFRDISDRKKNEMERIEALKIADEKEKLALVGRIAGKMAHDFNNILGAVMGNAELALLDCPDEETKKTLELIFEQSIRGKNLTRNLVAFAKDQEPKQEFFKIEEKLDLVISLLRKDLEGIRVTRDYGLDIPELLADPGMIEHAVVNLLQNAIHAVSLVEEPHIGVRTSHANEWIIIEVTDNGCGMPEECIAEIFDPSFTLKGGRDKIGLYRPEIKGTGYGMSNVKKYIEKHRGNIAVQSKLHKGTIVTINVPVTRKELTDEEILAVKNAPIRKAKNILIVEDEPAISDVLSMVLTREPFCHRVDVAGNGREAKDLMAVNDYDLISLDYRLPGTVSGMDVYHDIRREESSIPVIFVSGNIEFLESIKAMKQKDPFIDHLSKPCTNIDYINRVNQLLGHSDINK